MAIDTDAGDASTLLPDTSTVLAFRFEGVGEMETRGQVTKVPGFALSGIRNSTRRMTHAKGGVFLTVFTEAGASAFLREPLDEVFDDTIPFDCFVDRAVLRPLEDRLFEAKAHAGRAEAMERFLLTQLKNPAPGLDVDYAVATIQRAHGNLRIEDLARNFGLSQSALERRFRKAVGVTPKKLASIARFQHAVRRHVEGVNFGEIAHEVGYFDQSHFVKDFKAFTGQAPETFFKTTTFW